VLLKRPYVLVFIEHGTRRLSRPGFLGYREFWQGPAPGHAGKLTASDALAIPQLPCTGHPLLILSQALSALIL